MSQGDTHQQELPGAPEDGGRRTPSLDADAAEPGTAQATVDGETTHLTKQYRADATPQTDIQHDREYYCLECWHRVTEALDGEGEYGHKKSCPHHYQRGEDA